MTTIYLIQYRRKQKSPPNPVNYRFGVITEKPWVSNKTFNIYGKDDALALIDLYRRSYPHNEYRLVSITGEPKVEE